jgi:hypothetical protein
MPPATQAPAAKEAAAKAPIRAPETSVTFVSGDAGTGIIIKGPPRQPRPSWSRTGVFLCIGLIVGAGTTALVLTSKRRRGFQGSGRADKDELRMPSEFKLKDSAIQPEARLGVLGSEERTRQSLSGLLGSACLFATNVVQFVGAKLPLEQVADALRALWLRVPSLVVVPGFSLVSLPASPEGHSPEAPALGAFTPHNSDLALAAKETPESPPAANLVPLKPIENLQPAIVGTAGVPSGEAPQPCQAAPTTASKTVVEGVRIPVRQCADVPVAVD